MQEFGRQPSGRAVVETVVLAGSLIEQTGSKEQTQAFIRTSSRSEDLDLAARKLAI